MFIFVYRYGELQFTYDGENKKDAIVAFMKNPTAPPVKKPKEADWAAEANSEIVHLTATSFEPALKDEASVLVMFYAPCKYFKMSILQNKILTNNFIFLRVRPL